MYLPDTYELLLLVSIFYSRNFYFFSRFYSTQHLLFFFSTPHQMICTTLHTVPTYHVHICIEPIIETPHREANRYVLPPGGVGGGLRPRHTRAQSTYH